MKMNTPFAAPASICLPSYRPSWSVADLLAAAARDSASARAPLSWLAAGRFLWRTFPRPFAAATDRLNHREICNRLFSGAIVESIYSTGHELLAWPLPSGRELTLRLDGCDRFSGQGEIMLTLADRSTGLLLASIAFSYIATLSGDALRIGGIFGYAGPCARQVSEKVSRELFGMQPESLALWCLRALAGHWGLQAILAVDSVADSELWHKAGGRPAADGNWELPLLGRRGAEEKGLSARHKGHEQRQNVLASLEPRLNAALAAAV